MSEPIKLIAQLDSVRTTKDGGSKIVFECGSESLDAVHALQVLNGTGEVNLAIAIVAIESTDFSLP